MRKISFVLSCVSPPRGFWIRGDGEEGHTRQDILKSQLNITSIESRRLNKAQIIIRRELLRLLRRHRAQMPQITLITHEHDHDITISMITQLLQPTGYILISRMLADIIDKQGADSAAVVGGGDGTVAFLPGGVPDLRFDGLGVDLDGARGEFDADGRFAVEVEFVAGETREEVGFSDAGVSDEDDCEGLVGCLVLVGGRQARRGVNRRFFFR